MRKIKKKICDRLINLDDLAVTRNGVRYGYTHWGKVMLDEKVIAEHDGAWNPQFSSDGKHFVYEARDTKGHRFFVLDEKQLENFDEVTTFQFSPDSKRYGYTGIINQRRVAIIDGQKKDSFQESGFEFFSPDGQRYVYTATERKRWFLMVNDQKMLELDAENFENREGLYKNLLKFSSDSKQLYFLTTFKSPLRDILFCNGEKIAEALIDDFVFSPSGKNVALFARTNDLIEKFKIDKLNAEFRKEVPEGPSFFSSANNAGKDEIIEQERTFRLYRAHLMYENGDAHALVVNNKEVYRTPFRIGSWGIRPHFTPDGCHIVFSVLKGNHHPYDIVIDGQEQGDEFRLIKPTLRPLFSQDGRHFIVFGLNSSRAVWRVEYDLEQFPGILV